VDVPDPRLVSLLLRWEDLRAAGQPADPAALCAGQPELLEPLREAIARLGAIERTFAVPSAAAASPAIPGYAIEGELGRGGMGVVYRARHLGLGRPCALKLILPGAADDALARFETEARALARLSHPGVVQVYEIGTHGGLPFMALEFCAGGSLEARLAKNPLPARAAAELVRALAEAVQAAHAAGVVHRDLKPGNVLLADDARPKLTDFGLAKRLDEAGRTAPGTVMGSPSYMPPEQAQARPDVGPPADVYSLGAILYECLAGRPPFRAATFHDTLAQVVHAEPVPVRSLNPAVPHDLETIAHKCLQKEPSQRYASAQALADDLGRFLRHEPIHARPVGALGRAARWVRRNPAVATLAAVAALLVVSLVGLAAGWAMSLESSNDRLRTSIASGWVRSLAEESSPPPLSESEIGSLTELAETEVEALRLRFLAEAARTPLGVRKFRLRAEYALQAVLGLNSARRRAAEQLLRERFGAVDLGEEGRDDLALVLAALRSDAPRPAGLGVAFLGPPGNAEVEVRGSEPAEPRDPGAARRLAEELRQTADPATILRLAAGLDARGDAEAGRTAGAVFVRSLGKWAGTEVGVPLARGLADLAGRMDRRDAARLLADALATTTDPEALAPLADGLDARADGLGPADAADAATAVFRALAKTPKPEASRRLLTDCLTAVLTRGSPRGRCRGLVAVAGPVALWGGIPARSEPLPDAALVALLKHPLCVGPARRGVLGELSRRHRRPFADQWDFVRYAEAARLPVDLAGPWRR